MARKPESLFWDAVRPLLAGLHAVRVENAAAMGTPDVNCSLGWIELKQVAVKDIPKRASSVLPLRHFTKEQRVFHLKRSRAGGGCWVLLLVDRAWLLFTAAQAWERLGHMTFEETMHAASFVWLTPPDKDQFQNVLRATA